MTELQLNRYVLFLKIQVAFFYGSTQKIDKNPASGPLITRYATLLREPRLQNNLIELYKDLT